MENTLWANTVLASGCAVGVVIYTGGDTRSVMNTTTPRSKARDPPTHTDCIQCMIMYIPLVLYGCMHMIFRFLNTADWFGRPGDQQTDQDSVPSHCSVLCSHAGTQGSHNLWCVCTSIITVHVGFLWALVCVPHSICHPLLLHHSNQVPTIGS